MELEKEIIFYKPNQLIMMGRSGLNRFQLDVMNIMLKKAQDMIALNGRISRGEVIGDNPLSLEKDLLDYVHKISMKEILEVTHYDIKVNQTTKVKDFINELQQLSVTTYDTHRFTSLILFQRLSYNGFTNDLEYVLGNSWTKCFYYDTCLINEDGSVNEFSKSYTKIGLYFAKKFQSIYISGLLEYVLRYLIYSKDKIFRQKFQIDDFKEIIGVKKNSKGNYIYPSLYDFKFKILNPMVEELKAHKILIEINILGRGKKFKEVEIVFVKDSAIPNFLYKGFEEEFKEMEKGNKFFVNILKERGKDEDTIKTILEGKKYSYYLKIMDRLKLIPVDEDEFDKGYRYIVK